MVCTNCGKMIDADSKFCSYCGNVQEPTEPANVKYPWYHDVPMCLVIVANVITMTLGGGADVRNIFNYVSAVIAVIAFASTFFLVPRTRKLFFYFTIVIALFTMFLSVTSVLPQ